MQKIGILDPGGLEINPLTGEKYSSNYKHWVEKSKWNQHPTDCSSSWGSSSWLLSRVRDACFSFRLMTSPFRTALLMAGASLAPQTSAESVPWACSRAW